MPRDGNDLAARLAEIRHAATKPLPPAAEILEPELARRISRFRRGLRITGVAFFLFVAFAAWMGNRARPTSPTKPSQETRKDNYGPATKPFDSVGGTKAAPWYKY